MSPIRVGLIGLDHVGRTYLEALESDRQFDVAAISDTSEKRLRDIANSSEAKIHPDCRSLVVAQTRDPIDALFVALPPHQALDLLPLATERGLALFCHAPVARTVEELRRVRDVFAESPAPAVLSERWSAGVDLDAQTDPPASMGRWFAARVVVDGMTGMDDWRGDAARAGGGALLYDGYDAVHALVSLAGIPDLVTAECGLSIPPGTPSTHDTEDAAAVALRFKRDVVGTLTVCRRQPEASWSVRLAGSEGSLEVSPTGMVIRRLDAPPDESRRFGPDALAADVARFGERRRSHRKDAPVKTDLTPHLHVLATIQAAYLSARTGMPESPAQFVETYS